ncbi:MAG: hypothetical protein HOV66_25540, partial [Streptomycetaceae bacterium]|nr:hypothetical protein [Streptomycetaceae bacterium]
MYQDSLGGIRPGSELVTLLVGAVRGISQVFTDRMTAAGFEDIRPTHGFALTLVAENG